LSKFVVTSKGWALFYTFCVNLLLAMFILRLRSRLKVKGIHTRQMTMDWYIRNRKDLVDIQTGETFENDLLQLIESLDTIPDKKPLLRTLKNLAKSDRDRQAADSNILSASKARWA